MEELIALEGLTIPESPHVSRATERLDKSVELAEHLRSHYGKVR